MDSILTKMVDSFVDVAYGKITASNDDQILTYAKQLLSIGSLYLEFADAVKEGDGQRVIRCWRYLLIIFHNSNRTNYGMEAILLLYQYLYLLTPQQAEQFTYNRFVNTSGLPGRNISADLHMEHLNRELKSCIATCVHSSKPEKAIVRIGKAIGTLAPVIDQFDKINNVGNHQTRHKSTTMKQDVLQVVSHINKYNILHNIPKRKFPTFPNVKSLLHKKSKDEILSWIASHVSII